MKLPTRIRYGVRLMQALAEKWPEGPVFLKDIAREEGISEKYLSLIIIPLRTKGLVTSTRGAHGGYTLARSPEEISVAEVVEAIDGRPTLVDCVANTGACPRADRCATRDVWSILGDRITETLEAVSLAELVKKKREKAHKEITYAI